jgi:hypothetical protein
MVARDPSKRSVPLRDVAAKLNRSPRTVRRLWAEERAAYEANATSTNKPWKIEGISRSTWYRRRQRRCPMVSVTCEADAKKEPT